MEIGEIIKALRKTRRLTQGQLVIKSGVSQSAISMIETGGRDNPTIDVLTKLSLALDTTPDAILRRTGWLPPLPLEEEQAQEAASIFASLPPHARDHVLAMMRGLVDYHTSNKSILQSIAKRCFEIYEETGSLSEAVYYLYENVNVRDRERILQELTDWVEQEQAEGMIVKEHKQ